MSSPPTAVFELGRNAISTLVQSPALGTGSPLHGTFPPAQRSNESQTAREIPPVALTDIELVESAAFRTYMMQMSDVYERLQQMKDIESETWHKGRSLSTNHFMSRDGARRDIRPAVSTRRRSSMSTTVAPSIEHPFPSRVGVLSRRGSYDPPPLSTIPRIYLDEDFHLENPRTFAVVSERSVGVLPISTTVNQGMETSPRPRKALSTNGILQEKLSWYIDIVEMYLTQSLSVASTTFFSALDFIAELESEVAESMKEVKTIRTKLASLNTDVVFRGLELLQKRRRRHNLQSMNDAVLQLKLIMDGITYCKSLIDEGNAEKALAELNIIELLIVGAHDGLSGDGALAHIHLWDLRRATVLREMLSDLGILRSQIGKVFKSNVLDLLIGDLRHYVQSLSVPEVLLRWEATSIRARGIYTPELSANQTNIRMTDELCTTLSPKVSGLHRSEFITNTIQAYRGLVLQEIQGIVRNLLPKSPNSSETALSPSTPDGCTSQEMSSVLTRNIRALDAEDFQRLLSIIYTSVAEALRRIHVQSKVLLHIACTIGEQDHQNLDKLSVSRSLIEGRRIVDNASDFEIQEEIHAELNPPDLLDQAMRVGHDQINGILELRSQQTVGLPAPRFLRYVSLNLVFAEECESISGRVGTTLKTIIDGHIKEYIEVHRVREIQTLTEEINGDNWQKHNFTAQDDEILKQILGCGISDPPTWTQATKVSASLLPVEDDFNGTEAFETDSTGNNEIRDATIERETFVLPLPAVLFLRGVLRFLYLMSGLHSRTPDIALSLTLYMRTFDTRCRELILGGGATRSAGLKKITTKHMALAWQSLSFIATLVPHVREFAMRHAPAGPLGANITREFDTVRRDLLEHQSDICQKLVEIMESRMVVLAIKAHEIEWDKESANDVRPYMVELVRCTGRLYNALIKYLPGRKVEQVMVPVFEMYRCQLGEMFEKAKSETESGCKCMLHDVEYLVSSLGDFQGFGTLGVFLVRIIEGKLAKKVPHVDPQPALANQMTKPVAGDKDKLDG